MKPSFRLIPLSVLCTMVLAACGSASHSATVPSLPGGGEPQAGGQSDSLAAWRAAVACARRHGMPGLPDPVMDASGKVTLPGLQQVPAPTPAVQAACGPQIRAVQAFGPTHAAESASDIRALLRVAACFRTHGYPHWPDPNDRGEFHVRSADAGTLAKYDRAMAACKSLFPPSGWHLTVTPSGQ